MTESERQALIRFHLRAAKAYRDHGKPEQAAAAERRAMQLQKTPA
jgi:hypothetical protein